MLTRKYWLGVGEPDSHRPEDSIAFVATSFDEIEEGLEMASEYFKTDLADCEDRGDEDDESNI